MSIAWMAPAALAGVALIALPIAVHLLVRQPARHVPFPSLRFLRETQLARLRRRWIQDGWLLLCRCAIVALAALALAGPVLRTDARMTAFRSRMARAIVVIESADDATLTKTRADAFATATFRRADIGDALADAVRWLDAQPPASREIVVTGRLRRGSLGDADLAEVPHEIGLRFEAMAFDTAADQRLSILSRRNGALVRIDRAVVSSVDATRVTDGEPSPIANDFVTVMAAPAQRDLANAALHAALDAGVPWSDFSTPVTILWDGGDSSVPAGRRIIRMPVPEPVGSSADAVRAALIEGSPTAELKEPLPITPEQLASWARAPGAVASSPLTDEGDRRSLWGAALIALLVEWRMRRARQAMAHVHDQEARVA